MHHRPLPAWYDDAKFGIFIHWGPYAIPAWAPDAAPPGPDFSFSEIPYTEWYWNSVSLGHTSAARHHAETYGDAGYEMFVERFRQTSAGVDLDSWADLFASAGARYVVLVTKHHDGFLMWPSRHPNPHRDAWASERDIVGELAAAVRRRGMRFGVYYSGGLDWTFGGLGISDWASLFAAVPGGDDYAVYADAHFRELIERYQPSVLWNDIHYPLPPHPLIESYYEAVPDGVVNDRFDARGVIAGRVPADYTTPEYATKERATAEKWETCRGIGHSFGWNRNEPDDRMLSVDALVRLLSDIVAKNGNLLLNVGPMADGVVPSGQAERLLGLGWWLRVNGEAVYGTRPWRAAEGRTATGDDVRFTQKDGAVYAIVLGPPAAGEVTIEADGLPPGPVRLLGWDGVLYRRGTTVTLPAPDGARPGYVLAFTP